MNLLFYKNMIFVIAIILLAFVVFIGFYMLSFNFFLGDFGNLYNKIFQGDLIVKRNFALTKEFVNYYNSGSSNGNNNFSCLNSDGTKDDDCLFRGVYGFVPPKKKIGVAMFATNPTDTLFLEFTGAGEKGTKVFLRNLKDNDTITSIYSTGGEISFKTLTPNGKYLIEIENLSKNWGQYYINLSKGEGLKQFVIVDENKGIVKQNYNSFYGSNGLFSKDIEYNLGVTLTIGESVIFSGISSTYKNYISRIHFNANGVNFGGKLIITNIININDPMNISIDTGTGRNNCTKLIQGYYRQPLRGNIVWPLDNYTLSGLQSQGYYSGLNITGGLYTNCNDYNNYIYGQTIYGFSGINNNELFILQSGREYSYMDNHTLNTNLLTQSLYFGSYGGIQSPIGLLYDSTYGIGFVGGTIGSGASLDKLITKVNTNTKMEDLIKGIDEKYIYFIDEIGGSAYKFFTNISLGE